MSVLFPKVNKPREWDFRPRYYDPEKEKLQKLRERHARARAEYERQQCEAAGDNAEAEGAEVTERYSTSLHRGSFREARDMAQQMRSKSQHRSKMLFWLALLAIVAVVYWLLR